MGCNPFQPLPFIPILCGSGCSACLLSLASAIALRHLVHRVLVSTVLALGLTEKLARQIAQFFLAHIIYTVLQITFRSISM